jgi:hypothetical protein
MLFIAGCTAACGSGLKGTDLSAPQLPVTKVVLYQNGIGYFEREGKLEGNILTLQIRPSQINDLLKSLTVIDRSSGRAMSVSLPLEKTSAQILSELPEQVRQAGGLLDVLRVFRGARVRVDGGAGEVAGRVVGVEEMQVKKGDEVIVDWRLTLRTRAGNLRVYPVSKISKIEMQDRTLSLGLDQSLDVSLAEGNWKPISLSVRLTGSSTHKLRVSYIVEMPLWKPAYRVVVGEDGTPLLQGWAVVDNVSGEDWNDVDLSLVAGTPMSFIYDLHSPQFTSRVDLTPQHRRVARAPVVEKSGVASRPKPPPPPAAEPAPDMARPGSPMAPRKRAKAGYKRDRPSALGAIAGETEEDADEPWRMQDDKDYDMAEELEEQVSAKASGEGVAGLFRYDLTHPVTVPDRSSTLVSIVNKRVGGKEVVYFRPEQLRGGAQVNPYRAVMFKNDTGFSLEKGPVAIFSHGTFVGEGFLDRMQKETTTFLTFSVDGNVAMSPSTLNKEEGLRLLKIIDGMIVSEVLSVSRTVYNIDNRHGEAITAYVKTPKRMGWKLRNQPEGTIELPDSFVVPVTVKEMSKGELTVDWVKPTVRRVAIDTSLSTNVLTLYLKSGKAPPAVQKTIDKILKLKARTGDIDDERRRLDKLHADHTRDQNRVRDNLNLLRKTKGNEGLRAELTRKLAKLEAELGKVSGQLVKLSEERARLAQEIKVLIRQISVIADK